MNRCARMRNPGSCSLPAAGTGPQRAGTRRLPGLAVGTAAGSALLCLPGLGMGWGRFADDGEFGSAEGSLPLDSFATPSLALAVLRQEAAHLQAAYLQLRDQVNDGEAAQAGDARHGSTGDSAAGPATPSLRASGLEGAIASVARFHCQIQELLHRDLDCRLLWIWAENHCPREFLDRYPHLVQAAPQRTEVVLWFAPALEAARCCGRSEELAEVLRHAVRIREKAGAIKPLAGLLEERGLDKPPAFSREGP